MAKWEMESLDKEVCRGKQWMYNAKLLVLFASCRLAIMTYYMAGKFGCMSFPLLYTGRNCKKALVL